LLAAQYVRGREVVADEPVLHFLQQQRRFGCRRFNRVERVDGLVRDAAFDLHDGPAPVSYVALV
jgi:hypothetical protein